MRTRGDHAPEVHASGTALQVLEHVPNLHPCALVPTGPDAVPTLWKETKRCITLFQEQKPHLVMSDGHQPSLVAAAWLRIPSVAVGHDLCFTCTDLPPGLPAKSVVHQRVNAAVPTWLSSCRVAVHFMPMTTTRADTWLARPPLPTVNPSGAEAPDPHRLTSYFRDDNGLAIIEDALRRGYRVSHFGPLDSTFVRCAGESLRVLPYDREAFVKHVTASSGVLCSAGSNLLAEAIHFRRPTLALFRGDDHEQRLNAHLVDEAGLGVSHAAHAPVRRPMDRFEHLMRKGIENNLPRLDGLMSLDQAVREAMHRAMNRRGATLGRALWKKATQNP